jgi:hypothetical protein
MLSFSFVSLFFGWLVLQQLICPLFLLLPTTPAGGKPARFPCLSISCCFDAPPIMCSFGYARLVLTLKAKLNDALALCHGV